VAAELGVNLADVTGTGPGGSVREADVRRAVPAGEAAAACDATPAREAVPAREPAPAALAARSGAERTRSMRQAIARLMARSKREIPHYYVSGTVDMMSALNWMHERNRELAVSERLVPAALLLKAAALAARRVPGVNGYWADDQFCPAEAVHLGLAISLRGGGLLTPAIHDAADLPLAELMSGMRDLVIRARAGRLRGSELTDATITVTNLGDQGVESVFGVIYPPQVALVGFGKITERPVAVGGLIGVRPVFVTTLAADHRASDGYTGARYLTALSDLLQRPEELL
jgi:pyruvate dehydrogenase E2 component (dihydrolipoamide acetyltransferase)